MVESNHTEYIYSVTRVIVNTPDIHFYRFAG